MYVMSVHLLDVKTFESQPEDGKLAHLGEGLCLVIFISILFNTEKIFS